MEPPLAGPQTIPACRLMCGSSARAETVMSSRSLQCIRRPVERNAVRTSLFCQSVAARAVTTCAPFRANNRSLSTSHFSVSHANRDRQRFGWLPQPRQQHQQTHRFTPQHVAVNETLLPGSRSLPETKPSYLCVKPNTHRSGKCVIWFSALF